MFAYLEITARLAYDMFSKYKYLIVKFSFSHLGFWSGNCFLIASFPDHWLLILFFYMSTYKQHDLRKIRMAYYCVSIIKLVCLFILLFYIPINSLKSKHIRR